MCSSVALRTSSSRCTKNGKTAFVTNILARAAFSASTPWTWDSSVFVIFFLSNGHFQGMALVGMGYILLLTASGLDTAADFSSEH